MQHTILYFPEPVTMHFDHLIQALTEDQYLQMESGHMGNCVIMEVAEEYVEVTYWSDGERHSEDTWTYEWFVDHSVKAARDLRREVLKEENVQVYVEEVLVTCPNHRCKEVFRHLTFKGSRFRCPKCSKKIHIDNAWGW